nr:transporter substrate-binding domain-containing protein [Pelomonas sp. P8]
MPPMAMQGGLGQRGVLLDLVEAVLQRADLSVEPDFFPWARAMLLASEKPRTLIMPLNRTPDREGRFQWLIKLYAQRFSFMNLAHQPRVDTAEQARSLRVAVLRGSSNQGRLHELDVRPRQLIAFSSIADMQRALQRNLADALYGSELIHNDAWRRSGQAPAQLQTGLTLESADIWLAAHSGVTDAEHARLRQAHEALLADGSIERLFKRYGLRFRPEDAR